MVKDLPKQLKHDFSFYTIRSELATLEELSTQKSGLTATQAQQRLLTYGHNEITTVNPTWITILVRQFKSSFMYLLAAAALLAFILGQRVDAGLIVLFILINSSLGFYQEYKSAQILKYLSQYTMHLVSVHRGAELVRIKSNEIVPGDIIILSPGDIIAADIRFIDTLDLTIDESALTGESKPTRKQITSQKKPVMEVYGANNIGFSGTTVVGGTGIGVVFATGRQTVFGGISKLTLETNHESSFEKGISHFSTFILRLVLSTLLIIFVANLVIKGRENLVELAIFSIALAVSVIPEALPIVITFSLSRGALRLARNKVVVKRLTAIEDLGSIEVLCTDKTGTLTENKLSVIDVFAQNQTQTLLYAAMAVELQKNLKNIDAFDKAIWEYIKLKDQHYVKNVEKVVAIPFDPQRRHNTVLIHTSKGYELIARGAAETIIPLSKKIPVHQQQAIANWIKRQGNQGNRVIAVAQSHLTKHLHREEIEQAEHDLDFLGLIAFADPIKPSTHEAVAAAKRLGVQIKILTGDSPDVAGSVASAINLITSPQQVITGNAFDELTPTQQLASVTTYVVFARVSPAQKFKIVKLLESKYQVGFLGEGINDAPALKTADVGLAVQHAADISRESADIILLKKNLLVIVEGITIGREVFANTTKYIKTTLSSNFGNFYSVAIASLLINYLPMLPLQILLVNLLTDFPMIAISGDSVDPGELRRPKNYEIKNIALLALILGSVGTLFDFILFGLFHNAPSPVLQTNWFIGSVLTELVFLFSVRTRFFFLKAKPPAKILIILTCLAACISLILPYTTMGQQFFKFNPVSTTHLLLIFLLVAGYFVLSEAVKLFYYKFSPLKPNS